MITRSRLFQRVKRLFSHWTFAFAFALKCVAPPQHSGLKLLYDQHSSLEIKEVWSSCTEVKSVNIIILHGFLSCFCPTLPRRNNQRSWFYSSDSVLSCFSPSPPSSLDMHLLIWLKWASMADVCIPAAKHNVKKLYELLWKGRIKTRTIKSI